MIDREQHRREVQEEVQRLVRLEPGAVPEASDPTGVFRVLSIAYYATRGAGLLLLLGALLASGMTLVYRVAGVRTTGTIVSHEPDAPQEIEFRDSAGFPHRFGAGAEASGYRPGARLEVVYLPRDPRWHRVLGIANEWGPPLFLGVFGAAIYGVSRFFGYFRLVGGALLAPQSPSK